MFSVTLTLDLCSIFVTPTGHDELESPWEVFITLYNSLCARVYGVTPFPISKNAYIHTYTHKHDQCNNLFCDINNDLADKWAVQIRGGGDWGGRNI